MRKILSFAMLLIFVVALSSCKDNTPISHKENMGAVEMLNCNSRSRICKTKCDFCN